MKLVSDLMIRNVLTHQADDTLQDVEQTMATHSIRHIPVLDESGIVVGLLSQKEFLAEAFRITDKFGAHNLRNYLAKTSVRQCMKNDIQTVRPDLDLAEAGRLLRSKRHGCLLVADEQERLLGIVSSQDFVRLAIELLEQRPAG
ncbi:HPP family protein [Venatoribacter cucullus]|uniref:CBS domain-containing protein n=1 Tax=Venatoribacter cucullus TaxID=2661630 RepID=A0A9E8FIV5_9GAMM|nr:CBS domain-containing protein [Venatoribacter cucullus]QQD20511.1 CBS domain-containing protein [Oceanospirillaceae bacterium ASx5O]QQD23214.1 CBS domain-containing protein [Venatoribacter cucullus]UZK02647.1 CBS domain-containing protein [Venatoribacter cucullus]